MPDGHSGMPHAKPQILFVIQSGCLPVFLHVRILPWLFHRPPLPFSRGHLPECARQIHSAVHCPCPLQFLPQFCGRKTPLPRKPLPPFPPGLVPTESVRQPVSLPERLPGEPLQLPPQPLLLSPVSVRFHLNELFFPLHVFPLHGHDLHVHGRVRVLRIPQKGTYIMFLSKYSFSLNTVIFLFAKINPTRCKQVAKCSNFPKNQATTAKGGARKLRTAEKCRACSFST